MAVFVAFVLLAGVAVTARLVDLQVAGRERYVAYGHVQRDGFRVLPAGRGAILDRDGQAFALSVPQPQVVADPRQIPAEKRSTTAARVAKDLGLDRADVEAELASDRRYVVLDTDVAPAVAERLAKAALPGIAIEDRYVRTNPSEDLARAIVGRALPDGDVEARPDGTPGTHQGLFGMERQYDDALRGRAGKVTYEKGPSGQSIVDSERRVVPARPGTDLYLTLDQSLQYETEQALVAQVEATGAQGAMAVVMHPSSGEVLAVVGVERGDDDAVRAAADAQAITSTFEPGSVNKMVTVAAAIEEGQVTPATRREVPDQIQLYDRQFRDNEPHPVQSWSTTDILVQSSNVGTIGIAQDLGEEQVDRYLRAFGFGSTTGLGFAGETAGIVRDVDDWSGVDIGAIPIGQGMSVTALQMLAAYNVIANDGVYVAPKLVAATDRGSGRRASKAAARRRVVSVETARAMREMLDKVVTDGTGKPAAVPGYRVGGKTGTARIPQYPHAPDDGYQDVDGNYHYQSSFVGTVDGTDLSIIVTVQDATTSIYGSELAAPVFAHLAGTALRRYQIPPPGLPAASRQPVPELSPSARDAVGEDVTDGAQAAAG